MVKEIIHTYGASGSVTSTFGKYIRDKLGYFFMDTADYFWQPTNPLYTKKRNVDERLAMMKSDIEKAEKVVTSGSLVDLGDELIHLLADAIIELAYNYFTGTINISGEKPVSHYIFNKYLASLMNIDNSFIIPDYKEEAIYHNLSNGRRKLLLNTIIQDI
ncbi:hypothetical protein ACN077_04250 [Clostridium chromiireducens]|uniref:hypothetical protein n=1 Tax=Clostridium chromiireducens TaxID=225345 RepID=UPI003AF46A24